MVENKCGKIFVVGMGPGSASDITGAALTALQGADIIVGYSYYIHLIKSVLAEKSDGGTIEVFQSGMREELARADKAIDEAAKGRIVVVVSSGDAGIYGMASLIYETLHKRKIELEVEVVPGISAFQKAAALLGCPTGHDFCVISLSDLMTPWSVIEKRIRAAARADFVTAVYNPRSNGRYWQLERLLDIFCEERDFNTPVGYVRHAGRTGEEVRIASLKDFKPQEADMFTVVIIGNSQSYEWNGKMITPRGYYNDKNDQSVKIGQSIMAESFHSIESQLQNPHIDANHKWPLLHTIHTTADFEMERLLKVDPDALNNIYEALSSGRTRTIVTDVTMVASGIRKAALQRMGIEVKCFLNDDDVIAASRELEITRAQAGIRKAVTLYPEAVFAFGNAPTALLELCDAIRAKKASPSGIVAAPVGFVHVLESKYAVMTFKNIPKIVVTGRKGGSNLAATIVNSILSWPDAKTLTPGRDV